MTSLRSLTISVLGLAMSAAGALVAHAQPVPQAPASAPAKTAVLFQGVRVFDGKADALTAIMNVLVEGNTIARISPDAINADGATVIDGKGRTLMPGLIDNHVHIFMGANTQYDMMSPRTKPEDMHANAAKEAEAMLLRGFTAVRDLGGPVFDLKKSIDAGKAIGPRIYPSGAMISQTSGHGDSREPGERSRRFGGVTSKGEMLGISFIADGRDEVLTATRENLRGGATQIKVMAGGGAASACDPLDVAQYTLDELKAAVEAADDWGTYVTVHAYTPKAVNRAIEAGVKCIEHGQLLDEATMKVLAARGIFLSLQCLDEAPATAPADVQAKKHTVVAGTDNAFKWAKQYGVKLAWGTDFLFNPAQNKNQNADILKLKAWFTPAQALKLVTHDNAQLMALCGLRNPYPGRLGVVEVGALADLLLVDGDPLADLTLVAQPETKFVVIMKDGKIYKNTTR